MDVNFQNDTTLIAFVGANKTPTNFSTFQPLLYACWIHFTPLKEKNWLFLKIIHIRSIEISGAKTYRNTIPLKHLLTQFPADSLPFWILANLWIHLLASRKTPSGREILFPFLVTNQELIT